jgi:hypothetical protein
MKNEDRSRSEREKIARSLGKLCSENLNGPVNGYAGKGEKISGKPHRVVFSSNRSLDGGVLVYGPNFILIRYQTSYKDLPQDDSRVFQSADHAREFIEEAFVNLNFNKALKIPTK